ncbi:MAG: mechanosensitive ion channel [Proteobacteria bacterium]|nr:mechanosensitive ion channel [Pseudomonadota bacterium]MBU4297083.1 mechanosensitive ion channel [Pseudomonadota bacterium]MCG2749964.1 mechanosensitive ion channel [Desulfobulbaceae bacterium]
MADWFGSVQELIAISGINMLAALAIFMVGKWGARFFQHLSEKLMTRSKVEPTLVKFAGNLIYFALLTFVILAALGQIGIQTTSFIAVIGAAGLAVGLALQGSLSNFAAGVLLILFRPFKKGDYIESAGTAGTVEEIQIFTTMLVTPDNKLIIVPNSKVIGDNIVNISAKPTRRVDFVFGVGYTDDIDKVKTVILQVLAEDQRVLQDPEVFVGVLALADSSVNFAVRAWVNAADYWAVFFDTNEKMKKRFDSEGISIPFPQRDIHLFAEKETA